MQDITICVGDFIIKCENGKWHRPIPNKLEIPPVTIWERALTDEECIEAVKGREKQYEGLVAQFVAPDYYK